MFTKFDGELAHGIQKKALDFGDTRITFCYG